MNIKTTAGCLLGILALSAAPLFAAQADLMDKSLEELLNMPVTSAGGREQKKNEVSQSMTVITREDIRRSGARNIPDLFFMVPGMQVKRIEGHQYAVAVRGPAYITTNNLLVLVDGAVVFDPSFNGMVWSHIPVSLDEIERIEIIRGPGGVLYSSNAVNGVINIFTRSSLETDNYAAAKGGVPSIQDYAVGGSGQNADKDMGVRAFGQFKSDTGYTRFYKDPDTHVNSDVRDSVAGMRFDRKFNEDTLLMVTSSVDTHHASDSCPVGGPAIQKYPGGMEIVTARFQQKLSDLYDYSIHADVVHHRLSINTSNDADVNTESFQTQHNLTYSFYGKHVTSVGAEIRASQPNIQPGESEFGVSSTGLVSSAVKDLNIASFFLQDEYRPMDKLVLTAGTRVDKDSYTPAKNPLLSPRASAVYLMNDTQSVRAVVQRSYRMPSVAERYIYLPLELGAVTFLGNTDLAPENVLTYEAGYHGLFLNNKLELDAAQYLSHVKDIILISDATPFPYVVQYNNVGDVTTLGTELSAKYNVSKGLMLLMDYGYIAPHGDPDGRAHMLQENVNYVSSHSVGTGLRFTRDRWTFDAYVKYFSKYTYEGGMFSMESEGTNQKQRGYWDNTLRLARKFKLGKNDAEAELVGQNLFGGPGQHQTADQYLVKQEVYVGLNVEF